MTQPTTAQAARSYLSQKNCTLWGEGFDISKPDDFRFDAAVAWLTAQVQAVNAERRRLGEPKYRTHHAPYTEPLLVSYNAGQQPERFTDEEAVFSD